jgi:hypothetical protein
MEGADTSDLRAESAQSDARIPEAASKALALARKSLREITFGATSFREIKNWPDGS